MVEYFSWLNRCNYTFRTIQNYCLALVHFTSFLLSPCAETARSREIRTNNDDVSDAKEWLLTQKRWVTPLANKQGQARNSYESLKELGKWIDFPDVIRMREELIELYYLKLIKIVTDGPPSRYEAYKLRNIVMVLLFTIGLPLRSQNLILKISATKQIAIEAKENRLVLLGDNSSLVRV